MTRLLDRVNAFMNPAKAETGSGAVWMTHDMPLRSIIGSPQEKMKEAQQVAQSNRWIRAAERVISHQFGTVPWHLEDDQDEEITTESPELQRALLAVMEKPYRPAEGDPITATPRTRSGLWSLTSRHMGVCGSAFWYLDQPDYQFGLPASLLYINPARMTPAGTTNRLIGWVLDKDNRGGGTPLDAKNVLHFTLEEPDDGFFPAGLVETAMTSVNIGKYADRHAAGAFSSGGKLPGVFSPKAEAGVLPPDVFAQLEKDLRVANEHPDATRRSVILRGPIDFTATGATPEQLDLVAVQSMSRDDILGLWGVPLSQLGIAAPVGLNSGSTKSYDEAALWQKAVGPRLRRFYEVVQYQFLDRLVAGGLTVELEIEEPEFDDDAPMYQIAASAINLPLTNAERRALIGKDPFGNPVLDDAIWMPTGIVPVEIEQIRGGILTVDEARANMKLGPIQYDETPTPTELIEQVKGGVLSVDEARDLLGKPPMEWDTTPTTEELSEQVKGGLLSIDEARAKMGLPPMEWDETPDADELAKQLSAGLLTVDEAREVMGRGPMDWSDAMSQDEIGALIAKVEAGLMTHDEAREKLGLAPMEWAEGLSHDEIGALIAEVEAGLLTHDEAREKLKLAPIDWTEDLSHDEVGALIAKVEAGLMTHDEARAILKLGPAQWAEGLSKDEVDTLNAQIETGLLTIEEARTQLNRPAVTWPDDLNAKIEQAGNLIKAGFDPVDVMITLGLPPIRHLGLPPVTLQKVADAEGLTATLINQSGVAASAKARIAGLRASTTRLTPQMEKAIAAFLAEQKREVVARIRAKSDHLAKKPGDVSVWWDAEKWDKRLAEVLEPYADQIAGMAAKHIDAMLGKADK